MATEPSPTYQLKIVLRDTSPPIWRRITLPAGTSLGFLHAIVQICFGWERSHLHSFTEPRSGRRFIDVEALLDDEGGPDLDEESVTVAEVLPAEGASLEYTYDFGDNWQHLITLEKVLPASAGPWLVRCTGGRRAMPYAEDIGGAWTLQAVLDAVADPALRVDGPWAELVETLREEGFDPALFDHQDLDRELIQLAPRPANPVASVPGSDGVVPGGRLCSCGEIHDDYDDETDFLPVRPVSLAPLAELASAARQVPLIDSTVRLAHWCEGGRAVTSRDVLKPALGRLAVQELELWARDDELAALQPAERDARLARLRSSAELPCLDAPWQLALSDALVEVVAGTARPGAGLTEAVGDEGAVRLWCRALDDQIEGWNDLSSLGLSLPLLGAMGLDAGDVHGLAATMLHELYELPDGEWLDTALLVGDLGADLPRQEARLTELLLLQIFDRAALALGAFQAAEVETGPGTTEASELLLHDILGGLGESDRDSAYAPLEGSRLRLTALGRHGLREHLLAGGYPAPLIGELADADAATLLGEIFDYPEDAADTEIAGWISHRGQAAAAAQLIDACTGLEANAAFLRVIAAPVLARLDDPGALAVLRKAAASQVPGCAQTAAIALSDRGEIPEGHGPELQLWRLIDRLWGELGIDDESLAEFLDEEREKVLPLLGQVADELWRCDHPATRAVLEAAGRHLRTRDKTLAKRLRRSATKVGSRR